jgi:hypothetical protein
MAALAREFGISETEAQRITNRTAFAIGEQITMPDLLMRLYTERYTGSLVLHFGQGIAHAAEFPQPPIRILLDRPQKRT